MSRLQAQNQQYRIELIRFPVQDWSLPQRRYQVALYDNRTGNWLGHSRPKVFDSFLKAQSYFDGLRQRYIVAQP
ncbi:hypothetical protein [Ferrimonas senticii]|uniref:hypothetical protein n=1 Tax=Ferrimonas senticii TaxID=394566 RepID=UPI0012EB7498|nr:hypothetical protein [Ferrimonas senticii]